MKYWLLTWNPKKWKWDTFAPDKAKTATGQLVEEKWACVNSSAAPGDMVFLARTGDELRGIIAKGRIVGPPFDARHYDDARAANGDTAQFVPIVFDDIRDPNTDSFLPTFQLKTEVDSNQAWTPQSSGISISDATGERLLERWNALPRPSGQSDFERGSRSMLKIETPGKVEPPSDFFGDLGSKLNRFMEIYAEKKARPFGTDEELWGLMQDVERAITSSEGMRQYSHLKVDWSVGNGNWARVPWIAIMDSRITTTTQKGTYIAFLFREDLSGVYLCLTQGVTEMKRTHGSAAGLELLSQETEKIRASFSSLKNSGFSLDENIDLRTDGALGRDYEKATIAYELFERGRDGRLETPHEIAIPLARLLAYYDRLVDHILSSGNDAGQSDSEILLESAPLFSIDDALSESFLDRTELERLIESWKYKKNLILQGAPGVGKTFIAKRLAYLLLGYRDPRRTMMIQFHQAYSYEDFVQGYRPTDAGGFDRKDGPFFEFSRRAEADSSRPYVFIIDEINRGNLAKVFGELMMLIEHDKRGYEFAMPLTYSKSNERGFSVPFNLHVLGLMNTSDRSLSLVDFALRRRFAFHTFQPQFGNPKFRAYLIGRGTAPELVDFIVEKLNSLNREISEDKLRLGPGFQIGHSFFIPAPSVRPNRDWFNSVIRMEIGPLLEEYWFDQPAKAEEWISTLIGS